MSRTYRLLMSGTVAFVCATALHAQGRTSKDSNPEIPGALTVTGCVERADEVASNGSAAATVDSLTFMLIHAAKGTSANPPKGTSGTNDTKPVAKGSMYRLDGSTVALNPHVGHKVEITGSLVASATPSADSGSPTPENAPRIKVDRVKMVSETCDR